jgi:hypothetical protein
LQTYHCNENPFLQKKIAMESGKLLLKKNKNTIRRSQKASNKKGKQVLAIKTYRH